MSDFSIVALEVPVLPPGHIVEAGAHLPELLGLAVGIPMLIFVAMMMLGMGPVWLKAARAHKGEVDLPR